MQERTYSSSICVSVSHIWGVFLLCSTCRNRKWHCSQEPCLQTCSVYGDGHYTTFDGKRFDFEGDCEYVLVQVTEPSPASHATQGPCISHMPTQHS